MVDVDPPKGCPSETSALTASGSGNRAPSPFSSGEVFQGKPRTAANKLESHCRPSGLRFRIWTFFVLWSRMPRHTPDCHLESSLDRVSRRKSTASPKQGNATCHFLPFMRWNGVSPSWSSWLNSVWRVPAYSTIQATARMTRGQG